MDKKKGLLYIIIVVFAFKSYTQNKQLLFGFSEIPQALMVNPGTEVDFKWHSGIPILSGIYAHAGVSGFAVNDLFANDGVDINSKLQNLLSQLSTKDFYTVNQQLEVFNIGFRRQNKKDYVSFGFYEEFDGILYHPKDIIAFANEGNADLNKVFNLSDLTFKAELLGVMHFGVSRKVNKKFTVGLRAKLYSSVFNATSTQNSGLFSTTLGEDNIYRHRLSQVNLLLKTSGIADRGELTADQGSVLSKFLMSGNMGLGVDFGLTYRANEKVEIEASIQDLGFIRHSKNITTYKIHGSQEFEGLDLIFPNGNLIDYWQNFEDDVEFNIPLDTLNKSYTTMRSLKFNTALTYKFGKQHNNDCLRSTYDKPRRNEIGVQLYSVFRPKRPQFAATLFYYRRLSKFLRTKFTYTVDEFSAKNIGFGLSTHIGKFNMYATFDNLLGFTDLSKSNNQTFQFGFNIIMDYDKTKPY
jgi:hypothetical protein